MRMETTERLPDGNGGAVNEADANKRDSLGSNVDGKAVLENYGSEFEEVTSQRSTTDSPAQTLKFGTEPINLHERENCDENKEGVPNKNPPDGDSAVWEYHMLHPSSPGHQTAMPNHSILKAGGGDADFRTQDPSLPKAATPIPSLQRALQTILPVSAGSQTLTSASPSTISCLNLIRSQRRVCFSDSVIDLSATPPPIKKTICIVESEDHSGRKKLKSFPRFTKKRKYSTKGENDNQTISGFMKTEVSKTSSAPNLPSQVPETNLPIPISSKHETLRQLASTLSSKSIRSKKLESQFQQTIRLSFFDYEARRASEDWKFRKSIETLDLEYQQKFLNLMNTHNNFQRKLREKFIKQVKKTEKKLKKVALKGHLNEGSCFNISCNISSFKINKY